MHAMLLEILADEAKKGNKSSNTFKTGSFAGVAKEISQKYQNNEEDHLRNSFQKSEFGWEDDAKMITCDKNVFDEEVVV